MSRGRLTAIFTVLVLLGVLGTATAEARTFGSRVLKRGAHGHDVRVLQGYLTRAGFATTVDGQFGPGTFRTVKAWESDAGRKVDGKVTKPDARALRAQVAGAPTSVDDSSGTADYAPKSAGTGGAGYVQTTKATLNPDGTATPPSNAPQAVIDAIEAGNVIAKKPYRYGGGHATWNDSGYDCSGSVSYALHGGGLLKSSLDSTGFESYGKAGPGNWITIYANAGHAYMVIAGLRFDTSGASSRGGSRWTDEMRSSSGYVVRHPTGY